MVSTPARPEGMVPFAAFGIPAVAGLGPEGLCCIWVAFGDVVVGRTIGVPGRGAAGCMEGVGAADGGLVCVGVVGP